MAEKRSLIYIIGRMIAAKPFKFLYKCEVRGKENIPTEGPVILVSSHISDKDPILVGNVSDRQVHYMAKDGLFKNKFIAWVLRGLGAFPVARGTGGEDALAEAYRLLDEKKIVAIFIEGTRSRDGELLKPKTGPALIAFKTKATVVPISIIAKGGTLPVAWRKKPMMINIGKAILFEDLGIEDATSMHFRRGAKNMMSKIAELRKEAIELLED